MTIKQDALELLAELYNHKIDRKQIKIDDILESLNFTANRFENAYDYLQERGLISEKTRTLGKTTKGLPNVIGLAVTSSGVDAIEEKDVFKDNFGALQIQINQQGHVNILNQNKGQAVNNVAAPVVKDAAHKDVDTVNYGNIIKNQPIIDNSATYDIDVKNVAFLEKMSIKTINKYGEKKPLIFGAISLIAGIITIFDAIHSMLESDAFFSWLPQWMPLTPKDSSDVVIIVGIVLCVFGSFVIGLIKYKYESQCPKCKKFYAMDEFGEPKERETKVERGRRITTTRHYKCKHCGFTDTKKFNEFIEN